MNEQIYSGHYQMTLEMLYIWTFPQLAHFFCSQEHGILTLHDTLMIFFFLFQYLFHPLLLCYHIFDRTYLSLDQSFEIDSLLMIFLNSPNPFKGKCCSMKRHLQSGYNPAQESTMVHYDCLLNTRQKALLRELIKCSR